MLRKLLIWVIVVAIAGGLTYSTYVWQHHKVEELESQVSQLNTELAAAKNSQAPETNHSYTSEKGVVIKVYSPDFSNQLASPIIVVGEAPGNWSFEASFPVKILDADEKTVAQVAAQMQGDWMTEKFVPFVAKLTVVDAASGDGTLVLQKDNPSGLDANNDSISIPIKLM